MKKIQINTLEEFNKIVADHSFDTEKLWVWRGQANTSWSLETSLERFLRDEGISKEKNYPVETFFMRLQDIANFLGNFSGLNLTLHKYLDEKRISISDLFTAARPYWDDLVILRHHGFPSYWLDWTQSPWVALYFAFEPAGSYERAIFIHNSDLKIDQKSDYQIKTLGIPASERRHSIQQCYLSNAYKIADERNEMQLPLVNKENKNGINHDIVPYEIAIEKAGVENEFKKIILPGCSDFRKKVLRTLAAYNINHFTLFANSDGAIRTAALNSFVLEYLTK